VASDRRGHVTDLLDIRPHPCADAKAPVSLSGELVLSHSTLRTDPVLRDIRKGRSGIYSVVGIAYFRVVHVPAYVTNVLRHVISPLGITGVERTRSMRQISLSAVCHHLAKA
jgi:hypothetical protein